MKTEKNMNKKLFGRISFVIQTLVISYSVNMFSVACFTYKGRMTLTSNLRR